MTDQKKFPFDFMECVEVTSNGAYLRVSSEGFYSQKFAYHSASASVTEYIGYANPGAGISASAWAIKQLLYSNTASGPLISDILWANGSLARERMWADRAIYTYS